MSPCRFLLLGLPLEPLHHHDESLSSNFLHLEPFSARYRRAVAPPAKAADEVPLTPVTRRADFVGSPNLVQSHFTNIPALHFLPHFLSDIPGRFAFAGARRSDRVRELACEFMGVCRF